MRGTVRTGLTDGNPPVAVVFLPLGALSSRRTTSARPDIFRPAIILPPCDNCIARTTGWGKGANCLDAGASLLEGINKSMGEAVPFIPAQKL